MAGDPCNPVVGQLWWQAFESLGQLHEVSCGANGVVAEVVANGLTLFQIQFVDQSFWRSRVAVRCGYVDVSPELLASSLYCDGGSHVRETPVKRNLPCGTVMVIDDDGWVCVGWPVLNSAVETGNARATHLNQACAAGRRRDDSGRGPSGCVAGSAAMPESELRSPERDGMAAGFIWNQVKEMNILKTVYFSKGSR